jgi:hypothetical protein
MIMKTNTQKKIVKNAASVGVKITIDKSLDEKYRGKVLFPEKLDRANEILSKMKNPLPA